MHTIPLIPLAMLLLELVLKFGSGGRRTTTTADTSSNFTRCRVLLLDYLQVLEVRGGFERLVAHGKAALHDARLPHLIIVAVGGLVRCVVAPHEVI